MNQLATITYQTIKYLEDTPCKKQTPDAISQFLRAIEPFKLTKAEKLALLNICPTTPVEIQLVKFLFVRNILDKAFVNSTTVIT